MAITDKIRTWFEKEYGYSLNEAFEITRQRDLESQLSVDVENKRLAEEIAKKTGKIVE